MMILHSQELLSQLSELEEKIQLIEKLLQELGQGADQEKLLRSILAKKYSNSSTRIRG